MILPTFLGTLFATGVVTIGTLASTRTVRGSAESATALHAAAAKPVAARVVQTATASPPSQPMPAYLAEATKLWTSTHDTAKVRELLQGALQDLAVADAPSESAPDADLAPNVVHLDTPVFIAGRALRSHHVRVQASNWRPTWDAWHTSLNQLPMPFDAGETSAIEISIRTW